MHRNPSCPSCSHSFTITDSSHVHNTKQPMLLQCGHSCCENCLLKATRTNKENVKCVVCKALTDLSLAGKGIKSLSPDIFINGVLHLNRKSLLEIELQRLMPAGSASQKPKQDLVVGGYMKSKICCECMKRYASCRCTKCDCIVCGACFDKIHHLFKTLRHHQAIPLDDEETQEEDRDSDCVENTKCPVHNRPIEYYCDNDDTLICGRCCITGDHKGHSVTSIEEKNKALAPQLESAIQSGSQILRRLKHSEKKLFGCDPDYSNDCNRLIEDVKSHFRWIHGLLQIREMDIIRDVNNTFAEGATVIQKMRSQLQESQRKVTSLLQAAKKVLNDNAVMNAQEILDKLVKASEMPCVLVSKDQPSQPHLRMNWEEKFITEVQSHGSIAGDVETLVSLVPQSEGGSELSDLISESDSVVSSTVDDSSDVIIEEENEESISETASNASRSLSRQSSTDVPRNKPRPGRVTRKTKQLQLVEVTHIKDPSCFMVQYSGGRELAVLQRNINKWCSNAENQKHRPETLEKGDLVLGKYTMDDTWYRARVRQAFYTVPDKDKPDEKKLTEAEVNYFDFGNSEKVPVDRLLKMQNKFMKHGDFAVECCLHDIVHLEGEAKWSADATQTFFQMTNGNKMLMSVIQEVNNVLHVDLCHQPMADIRDDRPVSVRDALVFLELANYYSQSHASVTPPGYTQNRQFLNPEPKHCMENFEAKVCHCNSPESFYLQEMGVDARYMENMMAEMEELYSSDTTGVWNILCPEIGMVCAAPLGEKAQWARARVLSLPGQRQVRLQFVDFGNVETVPSLQLKKLLDKFLYLPTFAIHCQLSDVIPIEESGWSPKAYKWCEANLKDIQCSATVIKAGGEKLHVQLLAVIDDLQYCVNWKLVRDKLAVSTGKTSKIPSNTDSSALENSLFLSRRKAVQAAADTTSDTSTPSVSKPSGPKVIVKRRPKNDNVSSSSSASSPVCVEGIEGDTRRRRSSQVTDSDSTLPNDSDVHALRLSDSKDSISSSQKESNEDEVMTQKRKPTKKKKSVSQPSKPPNKGPCTTQLEVLVTYFESPWKMYIQFKSAAEDGLNQLQEEMQEEYGSTPGAGVLLRAGEYCAAQRHDGKWYRGRIMNVIDSSCVTVFMEDFGFTEVVDASRLQGLPDRFIKNYRTFALLCHLADITPTGDITKWSKTAIEFVHQEVSKKKCFVSLKGEKDEKGSQPVDLLIETHIQESALEPASRDYYSLCDRLKQKGLAMPIRRRAKKEPESTKDCPLQTALAMTAKSPPPGSTCTSPISPPVMPLIMLKPPCLYFLPPEVPSETTLEVMPSYVDYGCIIFVHVMRDTHNKDEEDQMTQSMLQYFSKPSIYSAPDEWLEGQGCAAWYEVDQHWYRAKVLAVSETGDKIRVQYIDYGNSVWLTKDLIRPDINQFINEPQLAIECVLHKTKPSWEENGTWPTEVLENIHERIVNKKATIYVQEVLENGQLSVQMSLEGIPDLSDDLTSKGLAIQIYDFEEHAQISKNIGQVMENKCPYQKCDLPDLGTTFLVLVTHVEMPDVVYFQRRQPPLEDLSPYAKKVTQDLNQLEQVVMDLISYSRTAMPFQKPRPGVPCLAQFSDDRFWYRGLIISVREEKSQAYVVYVDYGNSEFVSFENLRVLPAQFMNLPAQAVRCNLCNVEPVGGEWNNDMLQLMIDKMSPQKFVAKIMSDTPRTVGVLYMDGAGDSGEQQYPYQSLADQGLLTIRVSEQEYPYESLADQGLLTVNNADTQEDDFLIPELYNMSPDKRSWAVIVESEEIENLESSIPKGGNSDLMSIDSDSTCTSDSHDKTEDESTGTEGKVSEKSEEKEESPRKEVKSSEVEDFEEDEDLGSADWVTTEESDGTVESEV